MTGDRGFIGRILMKFITSFVVVAVLSLTASRGAVWEQSDSFTHRQLFNTPGSNWVMPADYLKTTFQPFDSSLGTLESFTLVWTLKVQCDYVIGSGGNAMVTGGVDSILGGVTVMGSGGGNGHSVAGSSSKEFNANSTASFTVATISGNPGAAAYDVVTGASAFTAVYNSSLSALLSGTASVDVQVTAAAKLTYVYAAAPVPEPATCAALAGAGVMGLACIRRRRRN